MTRQERLSIDLQEILSRRPKVPRYVLNDLEKDAAMATSWHEAFKVWSAEFDAKLKELEGELNK